VFLQAAIELFDLVIDSSQSAFDAHDIVFFGRSHAAESAELAGHDEGELHDGRRRQEQ